MIAASFAGVAYQYNPGRLDPLTAFLFPPTLTRQAKTDRAVAELVRSKPALGVIVADTSVIALAPNGFTPGETVMWRAPGRPDTAVYFAHGYESKEVRRLAAAGDLEWHYRVPGTSLRLAADRVIAAPSPIAALLAPAERPE
jgi:hypothetical protein